MNLKEFLDGNKVIKESALAVLMWPDKKNQPKVFSNKINEKIAGSGKQRITEDDEARAKVVLLQVAERIKAYAGDLVPEPDTIVKQDKPAVKEPIIKKIVESEPTKAELLKQMLKDRR